MIHFIRNRNTRKCIPISLETHEFNYIHSNLFLQYFYHILYCSFWQTQNIVGQILAFRHLVVRSFIAYLTESVDDCRLKAKGVLYYD